jgi:regulator of replication initiation timing
MGGGGSKNVSKQVTEAFNIAYNSCGPVTSNNYIDIEKTEITQPVDCPLGSKIEINQNAGTDASCVIDSMQTSLAEIITKQSAKVVEDLSLGSPKSENINENKQTIVNYVNNQCGKASSTNAAKIYDTKIRACNFHYVANATAKQSCIINNLQDLGVKVENSQKAETYSFAGLAIIGIIIAVIILVIIVIVAVVVIRKSLTGGAKDITKIIKSYQPQLSTLGYGQGSQNLKELMKQLQQQPSMEAMTKIIKALLEKQGKKVGGGTDQSSEVAISLTFLIIIWAIFALISKKKKS